ncbi:MAG TPA: hypothetical protein VHE99_06200 [Gammaproteobacteria bacterium]|nr:hypothetical protein [Gammaproteobacteria bacterium]
MIKKIALPLVFVLGSCLSVTAMADSTVYSFSCPKYSDVKVTHLAFLNTAEASPTTGTPSDFRKWLTAVPYPQRSGAISEAISFVGAKLTSGNQNVECWYTFQLYSHNPNKSQVNLPLVLVGNVSNYTFSVTQDGNITATSKN